MTSQGRIMNDLDDGDNSYIDVLIMIGGAALLGFLFWWGVTL